jgi:hypothetical protein
MWHMICPTAMKLNLPTKFEEEDYDSFVLAKTLDRFSMAQG